ncbi:MAG: acetyl ornithine aminotransferase family protein, partial [Acidobacteria bacterium]|nr:acetyl ornithine aminotransferase family protein [Acidobacteriota bacterium]
MIDTKVPRLKTAIPGPEAKKILALDQQYISPSYTRDYPMVVKTGRGAMVEDVDGNVFLDFAAGIAVVSTGHCHPEVVAAIQKQAAELIHMSGTDFYYSQMPDLAAKLSRVVPGSEAKRVYFGNSGTEAVEAAIKLARYHTKRDKIIAYYGCFHGRTLGSLSLTASKAVQRKGFGPMLPGVFHIPYPNRYRCPFGHKPEDCCKEAASVLEQELFKRIVDPEDVAAIFIEPIQGEGGYVPAPADYLQDLQRICRKYGILLVCDEVQSGMGRTGKWFACQHSGIEPDIITMAKGIASGMPLGVMVARASVMNWPPGAHASTFGGNPVCIAAALATFDLLEKKYIENARVMGEFIFGKLADWPKRHRFVGDVRGKGLMIGVEIVKDQKTKERAPELRDAIVQKSFEKGLLILGAGPNGFRL